MKRLACLTFAALLTLPLSAHAQSASTDAYMQANDKMMKEMNAPMTGDADRDFVLMMIPHHQGAIDMAKIEMKYGHDRRLRAMAKNIIGAQEGEIAEMQRWLKLHPAHSTP